MARSDGYFKKGQSGNPGGRPKSQPGFREACRKLSLKALKALKEVLEDKTAANRQARVAAAKVVIEHGYGKATQTIENINEDKRESGTDKVLADILREHAGIDITRNKKKKPVH